MQAKPKSIDEYLATLSGTKRASLERLRGAIRAIVPKAEEWNGCSYFPFSGTTLRTLAKEIAGYEHTKSALHFDPEEGLATPFVRKLLRARIVETK